MATSMTKRAETKASNSQGPLVLGNGVKPDLEVMRKAAAVFKLPVPSGKGDSAARELVGALRVKIAQLTADVPDGQQLHCEECGERSTDDTEYCPFCGDMGIAPEDEEPKNVTAAAISKLPEVSPQRDVEGAMTTLSQQLQMKLDEFQQLKSRVVDTTYEMGEICRDIHDRQLFKAKGFDSFKQFADSGVLPVSRTTAYALIKIVENFTREQYQELGYKKLRTIGLLDSGEERDKVIASTTRSTPTREVEQKVKAVKDAKEAKERRTPAKEERQPSSPPPKQGKVTLLTTVDGKPRELRFKSAKTSMPLGSAGKITQYDQHAYAEIELDGGVFLRIGLRVSGRDLVGLSAEFRRVEEQQAAAAQ